MYFLCFSSRQQGCYRECHIVQQHLYFVFFVHFVHFILYTLYFSFRVTSSCFSLVYFNTNTLVLIKVILQLFHDIGRYHIETSPLICRANQWTGFYMIMFSFMKELIKRLCNFHTFFSNSDRKRYVQKQPPEVLCNERCSQKFCKVHRKTPVPESLF